MSCYGSWVASARNPLALHFILCLLYFSLLFITKLVKILRKKFEYVPLILFLP